MKLVLKLRWEVWTIFIWLCNDYTCERWSSWKGCWREIVFARNPCSVNCFCLEKKILIWWRDVDKNVIFHSRVNCFLEKVFLFLFFDLSFQKKVTRILNSMKFIVSTQSQFLIYKNCSFFFKFYHYFSLHRIFSIFHEKPDLLFQSIVEKIKKEKEKEIVSRWLKIHLGFQQMSRRLN